MFTNDIPPLLPDSAPMNQVVFALQARLVVVTQEMLFDYVHGSYKQLGDNAKQYMRERVGFVPSMRAAIHYNMMPILRGAEFPWLEVMSRDWGEGTPTEGRTF
jgi:hypothetical protein